MGLKAKVCVCFKFIQQYVLIVSIRVFGIWQVTCSERLEQIVRLMSDSET